MQAESEQKTCRPHPITELYASQKHSLTIELIFRPGGGNGSASGSSSIICCCCCNGGSAEATAPACSTAAGMGIPFSSNLGCSSCSNVCICCCCEDFFRRRSTNSGFNAPLSPGLILNSDSLHSLAEQKIRKKSSRVESPLISLNLHIVRKLRYQRAINTAIPVPRNIWP